jgi:hypothetical protein
MNCIKIETHEALLNKCLSLDLVDENKLKQLKKEIAIKQCALFVENFKKVMTDWFSSDLESINTFIIPLSLVELATDGGTHPNTIQKFYSQYPWFDEKTPYMDIEVKDFNYKITPIIYYNYGCGVSFLIEKTKCVYK